MADEEIDEAGSDAAGTAATEGTSRIGRYIDEGEAKDAGRSLLEAGITPVIDAETDPISQREIWWLAVFPADLARACELLGVPVPEAVAAEAGSPDAAEPITKEKAKWRLDRDKLPLYILLYVGLVIVVTVGVFLVTVFILGGFGDDDLPPPPTGGPVTTIDFGR